MESNTGNDAPNTAEENQVTETEIDENTEVENSADPEPTSTTEDAGGQDAEAANNEEECPDTEIGVEASGEQGNTTKDDNNEKGEGDETAESNDKENESIEKMDEDKNSDEKKDESEKMEDNAEKETEKLNYADLAPWFNEELHRLCKKNQQLYKRARENKNQTRIWEEFKEHQNNVHQEIRKIKREYQEKNSLSDDDMAKLSTKSASRAREYGLLDFDVKVITDGRNLKEPENKGSHKREHGGWISPQEKRKREQAMREYYKMYY